MSVNMEKTMPAVRIVGAFFDLARPKVVAVRYYSLRILFELKLIELQSSRRANKATLEPAPPKPKPESSMISRKGREPPGLKTFLC
jgi:hypothetical protein